MLFAKKKTEQPPVMQRLQHIVAEFVAGATEGRLAAEVAAIRTSPEAEAARAARETSPALSALTEDPECRMAQRVRAEIMRQEAAVETYRQQVTPTAGIVDTNSPELTRVRELQKEIAAGLKAATAWLRDAEAATRAWIYARRRDALREIDVKLLAGVTTAHGLALERQEYTAETARLAEMRDGDDPGDPFPTLLGLGDAIEKLGAQLAGTPRVVPAPVVPPGRVALTITGTDVLFDAENQRSLFRGDRALFSDATAKDLVKRKVAEPAEVGA